jgi:hypothetical protein
MKGQIRENSSQEGRGNEKLLILVSGKIFVIQNCLALAASLEARFSLHILFQTETYQHSLGGENCLKINRRIHSCVDAVVILLSYESS